YQQYKNNKLLKNKIQYTIICLGESTTANEYPIQLQQLLNEKYPNKFSVIDCGIEGTRLETLLDLLDKDIEKYNPDIAICMMGINNFLTSITGSSSFLKQNKKIKLKTYKLFLLLKEHLQKLGESNKAFADNDIISLERQSNILYSYGDYTNAEKICKEILKQQPLNEKVFFTLFTLYHDKHIPCPKEELYNLACKALENNFKYQNAVYYKTIIEYQIKNNNMDLANEYISKAIKDENINSQLFLSVLYLAIKPYINSETNKLILEKIEKDTTEESYGFMAIQCLINKDYTNATKFFRLSDDLRLNFPNIKTYDLYRSIIKKLTDKNIKVICMQYPTLSIEPLKQQLYNEKYYNKITLLSNEYIFKEKLKHVPFNYLFEDQFGGSFGHCTKEGNLLIAENIAEKLKEILF
nr:hypothetical protein [Endomicrobiaceae bacterium]